MIDEVTISTPQCFHCKEYGEIVVDAEGFYKWTEGYLIQDAFPDLNIEIREQLVSGTHPECWDEMMKDDDDE